MRYEVWTAEDYRQMPWKNGRGVTCEIGREPADGSDDFTWRLSVADIKEDGPFSLFSGCQRIISTLTGAGMTLTVDGEKSGPLLKYDPFVFSGEARVSSELIDGPIRDFNLIYRPGRCQARLEWLGAHGSRTFCSQAGRLLIYTVGGLSVNFGGNAVQVLDGQTFNLDNKERQLIRCRLAPLNPGPENRSCLIELSPR